jgi:hypothetical protein
MIKWYCLVDNLLFSLLIFIIHMIFMLFSFYIVLSILILIDLYCFMYFISINLYLYIHCFLYELITKLLIIKRLNLIITIIRIFRIFTHHLISKLIFIHIRTHKTKPNCTWRANNILPSQKKLILCQQCLQYLPLKYQASK